MFDKRTWRFHPSFISRLNELLLPWTLLLLFAFRFRDRWECAESQICHGVGLKIEEYTGNPPDLENGRRDTGCQVYTYVGLINQITGNEVSIKHLTSPIDIQMRGSNCTRPKCWYYNYVVQQFTDAGVFTNIVDGKVYCLAHHLSGFTLRTEPEKFTGVNAPFYVTLVTGILMILASFVFLVRAIFSIHAGTSADDIDNKPRDEGYDEIVWATNATKNRDVNYRRESS